MKELSWQVVLQEQQEDFVKRLKDSLSLYPLATLSCLEYNLPCNISYHSERIKILFDEDKEIELNNFCLELVDKVNAEYEQDTFISCKIGKIGEEVIKKYLGNLITDVDYQIYDYGDGGLDFSLINYKNISIQVKTKTLSRITLTKICKDNLNNNDIVNAQIELYENGIDKIDDISWTISEKEIAQNKVLICVLLLNYVEADTIKGNYYDCIIAGFKPTSEIMHFDNLKIQDLFYIGGIRSWFKLLI